MSAGICTDMKTVNEGKRFDKKSESVPLEVSTTVPTVYREIISETVPLDTGGTGWTVLLFTEDN